MKQIKSVFFIAISIFAFSQVQAQSKIWNGSSSSDWSTASNWTPAVVPIAGDSVVIPNTSVESILTTSTPDLLHVQIQVGGILRLMNTSRLNVDGSAATGFLFGVEVRGELIVSSLTDTVCVKNTSSDGIYIQGTSSNFDNDGVIITEMTTFGGIHFFAAGTQTNNGQCWVSNVGSNGFFVDDATTILNAGLIVVDNCGNGLVHRTFSAVTNELVNFGEIRIGAGVSTSIQGLNLGGEFLNQGCAVLSVEAPFGTNMQEIQNFGLINYYATSNNYTGFWSINGFQYDPNAQLPSVITPTLTSPLNLIQFSYDLDGDGLILCDDEDLDDIPAENDVCATAIDYETAFGLIQSIDICGDTNTLDFSAFGDGGFDPTCDFGDDAVAWYTWTATDSVLNFITISGAIGLEVLTGSCGNLTSLGCLNNQSGIITGLSIGAPYYFMIWDDGLPGTSNGQWFLTTGVYEYNYNPICGDVVDYPICDHLYPSNDNQTFTICPTGPDTASISFTFFDVEDGFDFVEIKDDGVQIANLTGLGLVDSTFTASDIDHCLEVIFTSDNIIQRPGFTFVVNCAPICDVVSNTNDDGPGSLREAVNCAVSGDTIRFDPGIDGDSIKLTSGEITVSGKTLTILGNGRNETIIDGMNNNGEPLFSISDSSVIELRFMKFQHAGDTLSSRQLLGGAILNQASRLKVVDCHFENNQAFVGGALVSASGKVDIINCQFNNNLAQNVGALVLQNSPGSVVNSLFHDNTAIVNFGAFLFGHNSDGSTADRVYNIINNTITNNSAGMTLGGMAIGGGETIANFWNNMVSGNSADSLADFLFVNEATMNSIVNASNNIFGDTMNLGINTGFIQGIPDFVDAANNNYALLPHSIGIDGGDDAFIPVDSCDADGDGNTTEQLDVDLASNQRSLRCNVDIGAYEFGTATFCPAVNDLCTGALSIGCGSMIAGDLSEATTEGRPSVANQCIGSINGLWYSFIGTGDSVSIEVAGVGSGIQVFTGGCNSFICFGGAIGSQFGFVSTLGEDYLIYIDGNTGSTFTASLTCFSDCPSTLSINGTPAAGSYFAENSINSNATIESPNGVIYQAGDSILLKQGFEVELGAEFSAVIGDCP